MKNKKGISAIVATVLIILITVAAVTIIWAAIIPMIQDQIGGSTECFDASASLSVTTDFSCVNDTHIMVQVHRGTGNFVLMGIEVIIGAEGTTNTTTFLTGGTEGIPDVNGDRVYTIDHSLITDFGTPSEAGVAAMVKTGSTTKTCEKSGMVQIPTCS